MSTRFPHHTRSNERGSVLIQVAIAMLAMTAFSALVIDYGFMWVARAQAQNSADMAAHAGAVALMLDYDPEDVPASQTRATAVATAVAGVNKVGGAAPTASTIDVSVTDCAGDGVSNCLDAKVYRNSEKSNRLPVFFGNLLSAVGLGAKARATTRLELGVGSDCLAPFAIPDKWNNVIDGNGNQAKNKAGTSWDSKGTFDGYCNGWDKKAKDCDGDKKLNNDKTKYHTAFSTPDVYTPPSSSGAGTGYKFTNPNSDYGGKDGKGVDIDNLTADPTLTTGDKQAPQASLYIPLDIARADGTAGTGVTRYVQNIKSCNGTMVILGDEVPYLSGVSGSDTDTAITAVQATDSGACWGTGDTKKGGCGTTVNGIQNSCITSKSGCAAPSLSSGQSPRVLQIPMYDPKAYEDCRLGVGTCGSYGPPRLKITNISGCFVSTFNDKNVGNFTCYLLPVQAVTCSQAKAKGKKDGKTVTCPTTSFDSFLRNIGMYQ
jgi:Flp pilus assembly protein TadG